MAEWLSCSRPAAGTFQAEVYHSCYLTTATANPQKMIKKITNQIPEKAAAGDPLQL
ncbi:hypothetical protein [Collimonas sp. PA-H2]|uniref:hypothetical protein n=1 Tax=Collimonas sp. PA-H2 TaxID=1881062 RepID=UPI00130446E0|nr:hypothetical protein [Collimonas sp. PA-H2]